MTSQDLIEHLSRGGSGSSGDSVSSGSSSCVLSQSKDDGERGAANTQSSFVNRIVPDERKPEREENKSKDKPEESVLTATNGVSSSGKKDRRCKIVIDTGN